MNILAVSIRGEAAQSQEHLSLPSSRVLGKWGLSTVSGKELLAWSDLSTVVWEHG